MFTNKIFEEFNLYDLYVISPGIRSAVHSHVSSSQVAFFRPQLS